MPKLRSKDDNLVLYGRSAQKMPPDQLPLYADVDLSVEFYKQAGYGEWEAIKRTSGDLLSIYSRTQIKIQESKSLNRKIKTLRSKRLSKLKELSKDTRTGSSRYRGKRRISTILTLHTLGMGIQKLESNIGSRLAHLIFLS